MDEASQLFDELTHLRVTVGGGESIAVPQQ
jgi:hypothetical protein